MTNETKEKVFKTIAKFENMYFSGEASADIIDMVDEMIESLDIKNEYTNWIKTLSEDEYNKIKTEWKVENK